jgi:hypothetical protein
MEKTYMWITQPPEKPVFTVFSRVIHNDRQVIHR